MVEKNQIFNNAKRNIEIEIVRDNIELLKKYKLAKTEDEKNQIMSEMDENLQAMLQLNDFLQSVLKTGSIDELISRLEKAIELDSYRPRNLSLFFFAVSEYLYNVVGNFDTLDLDLVKAYENGDSYESIASIYNGLTLNRFALAKQFTYDWIQRLNANRDLVKVARNAKPDEEIDAYNKLFSKLAMDFCDDYNFPRNSFDVKVVKDWENSDVEPPHKEVLGFAQAGYWLLEIPKGLSEQAELILRRDFDKSPENCSNSVKVYVVRMSMNQAKFALKNGENFFYKMVSWFVHEMHHCLDKVAPSLGALGPQVLKYDNKTYVSSSKDYTKNYKSATELSSYEIEKTLFQELKNQRY